MTADGWQFVGWALDAGDGVYKAGEKIYSDVSIHGIPVETQVAMADDGLTLYGRWIRVYSVTYDGNTNSGGSLRPMLEAQSGTEVICTIREMKLQSKNREILKKLMRTGPAMYLTDGLSIRMARVHG